MSQLLARRRQRAGKLSLSMDEKTGRTSVQLLPVATCFCFVVLLVVLPLRFIGIEQRSAITGGLMMMALSAPMLVVPILAGRWARHLSARALSSAGLLAAAAGLVWLGAIPLGHALAVLPPMTLIGAGAGLPWGLMDGLSISVVPKERAGMATGIFGTVRVAGEGVALAIVSTVLAVLMSWSLGAGGGLSTRASLLGGQQLAVGDIEGAVRILPGIHHAQLMQAYGSAFASLCWGLAVMTVLCGFLVYRLLPGTGNPSDPYSALLVEG